MRCVHIHILLKNRDIASRFLVMETAYKYGITGSVQRKGDTFFVIAEGEESSLNKFINWCETFQVTSDCVSSVEEKEVSNRTTFDIIRERGDGKK